MMLSMSDKLNWSFLSVIMQRWNPCSFAIHSVCEPEIHQVLRKSETVLFFFFWKWNCSWEKEQRRISSTVADKEGSKWGNKQRLLEDIFSRCKSEFYRLVFLYLPFWIYVKGVLQHVQKAVSSTGVWMLRRAEWRDEEDSVPGIHTNILHN